MFHETEDDAASLLLQLGGGGLRGQAVDGGTTTAPAATATACEGSGGGGRRGPLTQRSANTAPAASRDAGQGGEGVEGAALRGGSKGWGGHQDLTGLAREPTPGQAPKLDLKAAPHGAA